MRLAPAFRRATLVAHLLSTLGWFGAVAAFLTLSLFGLFDSVGAIASACYRANGLICLWLVTPLRGLALLTGLIQALGTAWRLTRHWWVFIKLLITGLAVAGLAVHLRLVLALADAARAGHAVDATLHGLRLQLVVAPALALILLATNATLGVIKPAGLTPFAKPGRAA